MGNSLRQFAPANLYIISANPDLLHRLRLKRVSKKAVKNGPIDCVLAGFEIELEAAAGKPAEDTGLQNPVLVKFAMPSANLCFRSSTGYIKMPNTCAAGRSATGQLLPDLRRRFTRVFVCARCISERNLTVPVLVSYAGVPGAENYR